VGPGGHTFPHVPQFQGLSASPLSSPPGRRATHVGTATPVLVRPRPVELQQPIFGFAEPPQQLPEQHTELPMQALFGCPQFSGLIFRFVHCLFAPTPKHTEPDAQRPKINSHGNSGPPGVWGWPGTDAPPETQLANAVGLHTCERATIGRASTRRNAARCARVMKNPRSMGALQVKDVRLLHGFNRK
jgi:hypothetical protein